MKTVLICFVLVTIAFFAGGACGAHLTTTAKGINANLDNVGR